MKALVPCCALLALASSCIHRGYPLGTSGAVDIRVDVAGALFARDGKDPDGARQTPSETGVTLALTEDDDPAYGGYVDVQVSPPEALTLTRDPAESEPTCVEHEGGLRCTGNDKGHARFLARSEGTWSGTASLRVVWGGNPAKEESITVLPAGLPADATDFRLVVDGLDESAHVLATYVPLQCTTGAVSGDIGSPWRPGAIRAREARVVASAPTGRPEVLLNAPVLIDALGADAAVSPSKGCEDRKPRLRVLLDGTGQSPLFYLCFSDRGGTSRFAVSSGDKRIDPAPAIPVDAEPRLLRVVALKSQVEVGAAPLDLFEVSAYDTDLRRIALPVDVRVDPGSPLALSVASVTLADEQSPTTLVQAVAEHAGTAQLHVSPRLRDMPDCASSTVTVVPPAP
jgi:hypothetical protein